MVDPLSLIPLHVETFFNSKELINATETKISDATAFVYRNYSRSHEYFLITNWHVVSGRNPETNRLTSRKAAIPNIIKVWAHGGVNQQSWLQQSFPLVDWDTDEKIWLEHPLGREVDVVAIPLDYPLIRTFELDPMLFDTDLNVVPSEAVSIIGFPFGMPSYGQLPIWKTGHIASDPEKDYDGKPVFLIDATVRAGMSGSPVIGRRKEIVGDNHQSYFTIENSDTFLGVFSGGISKRHSDIDIGMVWKPKVIEEILEQVYDTTD